MEIQKWQNIELSVEVLKKYLEREYYTGLLKFMLLDEKGAGVDCCKEVCGNTSNAVIIVKTNKGFSNVPYCKKHFLEIYPDTISFPVFKRLKGRKVFKIGFDWSYFLKNNTLVFTGKKIRQFTKAMWLRPVLKYKRYLQKTPKGDAIFWVILWLMFFPVELAFRTVFYLSGLSYLIPAYLLPKSFKTGNRKNKRL